MNIIINLFNNPYSLLITQTICFSVKAYILYLLFKGKGISSASKAWLFITIVVASTLFESATWIIKLCSITNILSLPYPLILALVRLAWAGEIIYYQCMILFLHSLVKRDHALSYIDKLLIAISGIFAVYFTGVAFSNFTITTLDQRIAFMATNPLEAHAMRYLTFFCLILMLSYTYLTIQSIKKTTLPRILRIQLKNFALAFIIPYVASEFISTLQIMAYTRQLDQLFIFHSKQFYYILNELSAILLTWGLLYCIRKVLGLRFLNTQPRVQARRSSNRLSFIDDFSTVLDQLIALDDLRNLEQVMQVLFKEAFAIPLAKTSLYIRHVDTIKDNSRHNLVERTIEEFLMHENKDTECTKFIKENKILIKDEIEFSNFYDKSEPQTLILQLLDRLQADVLIPIYEQRMLLAYIVIERNARPQELYTDAEQNEMVVLSQYLANVIESIRYRSYAALIEHQHKMDRELAHKDREVNHYRESLASFFHNNQERKTGMVFFRNNRFTIANRAAHDLLRLNLNVQVGHPLTKAIKQLAKLVEETKTASSTLTRDVKGNRLAISAMPSLDQSHVIMIVHYPEIGDILAKQVDMVQGKLDWDYLLYLETTHSGKLISQFIPADSPKLLNFKIEMLQLALSTRPILLTTPDNDLMPTVELLKRIGESSALQTIHLTEPCTTSDIAVSIFGINPLFETDAQTQPLLRKLTDKGTLFISNVQYLERTAQAQLAEYLRYGHYHAVNHDKQIQSKARVICSTNTDLAALVAQGLFDKALYEELRQGQLMFPSFAALSKQEIEALAVGYSEQAIVTSTFKHLLELTAQDLERLLAKYPSSLHEIKEYVHRLLVSKATKHELPQENTLDPAFTISDRELAEAARLGKNALRHVDVMDMLWRKFKCQNKIAAFLGVNRSSVSRRCRKYNLVDPNTPKKHKTKNTQSQHKNNTTDNKTEVAPKGNDEHNKENAA